MQGRFTVMPGLRPLTKASFASSTGDSFSYTTSRIDLTPLAGRTVKLPAKSVTGIFPPAWWIDNAQVYTCKWPSIHAIP
jgi:hypothetical protein